LSDGTGLPRRPPARARAGRGLHQVSSNPNTTWLRTSASGAAASSAAPLRVTPD
jgi:hypothetical protein